MEPDHYGTRI